MLQHLIPDQMEGKGTAVREGGLLAPGDAGADGDGADRRAGVRPAGPGDRPATQMMEGYLKRRPRIIKYNKEIHIMIIVPCNLMLEVTGKQCNIRVKFVLSSRSSGSTTQLVKPSSRA